MDRQVPKSTSHYVVQCDWCLKKFRAAHHLSRYCSDECAEAKKELNQRLKRIK